MSNQIDITQLTHEDVERWLEAERKRLGLDYLVCTASSWSNPRWTAHDKIGCIAVNTPYAQMLSEVMKRDPEAAKAEKISELENELSKLKGGEG